MVVITRSATSPTGSMGPTSPTVNRESRTSRTSRAEQTRQSVLDTAQGLFTQNGYDATSLQMIADEMGVTKAAVYYYFRTKAEILHAIAEVSFTAIDALIDRASQQRSRAARSRCLIEGFVDLLVAKRHLSTLKSNDPAIHRELRSGGKIEQLEQRVVEVLYGPNPTPEERVSHLLVLSVPEIIPALGDLSDDDLRQALVRTCLRLQRGRS